MKTVHIWHHKDGDHLAIHEEPWWCRLIEYVVGQGLCPCCGFSSYFTRWSDKLNTLHYKVWSAILEIPFKHEKILYEVSIGSGCVASEKIWGNHFCWRDDCEVNTMT